MAALGCRTASETTWSYVTALLYSMPGCKFAQQGPQDLHNAYVFTKKYGRQVMAAAVAGDKQEIALVERLPVRWQDHDARWLADALGAEKPAGVPAHVNLTSVGALARTIPNTSLGRRRALLRPGSLQRSILSLCGQRRPRWISSSIWSGKC